MILHYCPSYKGFVYSNLETIKFNEKIVDTSGLIEIIRLHAGLKADKKEGIERTLDYYKAMKCYMEKNPGNVLEASFEIDGLSVAKECLKWRDTLCFAGWNKTIKAPGRMEVLAGVEEYFADSSTGEDLVSLIDEVKAGCLLPANLEIITPIDYKLFSPLEVDLLEALIARGVCVKTLSIPEHSANTLSSIIKLFNSTEKEAVKITKDETFKILHFEEQDEAYRYLSLLPPDSYDVWINSDNKALDNWLFLQGKPAGGSSIKGGLPQITQILPIGLGIFAAPLNLKNLIEWLNIPLSPFPLNFRSRLKEKLTREGGYYNKECKEIIDKFIGDGKDEAEQKKRSELIKHFLPDINTPASFSEEKIEVERIKNFVNGLYSWCGSEMSFIQNQMQKTQLQIVRNECTTVLNMLEDYSEKQIDFSFLMTFVTNLKDDVDLVQYEAQCGSRTIIKNPGNITSPVKNLIWCDFYNEPDENLKYDFLLPGEREAFEKSLKLWNRNTEREYNNQLKRLPFLLAEKITLVIIDKKVTENVQKHPVFIQLENKVKNIKDFIISPDVNEENKGLLQEASIINNRMAPEAEGIEISNGALIKWPDHESASSLEELIYNPFDYAFNYLAGIKSLGNESLPLCKTSFGTVAHGVIETLFNRYNDIEGSGTAGFIKENIKNNFDKAFTDMVNAKGAVLLLKENISNLENYKTKVRKCVNALVKVLEDNHLHVVACEPELIKENMGFEGDIKIKGFVDMLLADEDNVPVIFDFKWTSKPDDYKKKIKENKSIQLELYKSLIEGFEGLKKNTKAKAVAYIILPDVIIFSKESFIGENAIKVTVDNNEDLLPEIKNSYKYRREQISGGFIEEATEMGPDKISYQKAVEYENLIPLKFESKTNPKKEKKSFPKYELFKGKK